MTCDNCPFIYYPEYESNYTACRVFGADGEGCKCNIVTLKKMLRENEEGILRYADDFSSKHGYRKPDYFYLSESSMIFKVSHLKKCERK